MGIFDFEETSKNFSKALGEQRELLKTDLESIVDATEKSIVVVLSAFRKKILIPILTVMLVSVFLSLAVAWYAIEKLS